MGLFRKLNSYELANYVRRVPSPEVLTAPEKAMYTGIFARGYDSSTAYNYFGTRVRASRTGYLRGLGDTASGVVWWNPTTWATPGDSFFPGSGTTNEPDCTGLTPTQCAALRLSRELPPGSEVEIDYRSSADSTPPPPPKPNNTMKTVLWIGAGIIGLALVARMMKPT
jgi:hypothetical protein